ncbi:hypothetical protein ZWY2020_030770 [Hordeum vulgare]|nr:hypothetical protein ZWY2020_030770 [Hordeum vulgare]
MVSALAGVMTSVIGKLTALLREEYAKLKGVHREVEFMKDELSSMNALLQRLAEVDRDLDAQMKEWRDQVREMSYNIEDCIDDFMSAQTAWLLQSVVQQLKCGPHGADASRGQGEPSGRESYASPSPSTNSASFDSDFLLHVLVVANRSGVAAGHHLQPHRFDHPQMYYQQHGGGRIRVPLFTHGGRGQKHFYLPPPIQAGATAHHRYEVLMKVSRLAAEYLVAKGVLPPASLQGAVVLGGARCRLSLCCRQHVDDK